LQRSAYLDFNLESVVRLSPIAEISVYEMNTPVARRFWSIKIVIQSKHFVLQITLSVSLD